MHIYKYKQINMYYILCMFVSHIYSYIPTPDHDATS